LLLGGLRSSGFLEACARGLAEEDMAALVKLWEEPAGVTVDSPAKGVSMPRFRANLTMLWPELDAV